MELISEEHSQEEGNGLRWAGHVARMEEGTSAFSVFYRKEAFA